MLAAVQAAAAQQALRKPEEVRRKRKAHAREDDEHGGDAEDVEEERPQQQPPDSAGAARQEAQLDAVRTSLAGKWWHEHNGDNSALRGAIAAQQRAQTKPAAADRWRGVAAAVAPQTNTQTRRVTRSLKAMLATRMQAVEKLSTDTRNWLNLDKYGRPLPEGEVAKAQDDNGLKTGFLLTFEHYQRQLWLLMTDADSSRWAFYISVFMVFSIILSTVSFVLETIPGFSKERNPAADKTFVIIEAVTVNIFLADYTLRILCCNVKVWRFMIQPLNIIDLVSIVPWYIELAMADSGVSGTSVFRVLRLLRVFRVLKLGARYKKLLLVTTALSKSIDMLCLVSFLVTMVVIISATLMFFAERGDYDEELKGYVRQNDNKISPFESIPAGFWWAIVTVMTVGYGDAFPITTGGRLIAGVTMLCGILALALPIAVIGTNFTTEWEEYRKRKGAQPSTSPNVRNLVQLLADHTLATEDLMRMFDTADRKIDEARGQLADKGNLRQRDIEMTLMQRQGSFTAAQRAAAQQAAAGLSLLGRGAGLFSSDSDASATGPSSHAGAGSGAVAFSAGSGSTGDQYRLRLGVGVGVDSHLSPDDTPKAVQRSQPSAAHSVYLQHAAEGHDALLTPMAARDKGAWVPTAADGAAMGLGSLKAAIDALAGTALHQRLTSELAEIVAMQPTVAVQLGFLENLLKATDLLYSGQVPEMADHMRLQYRQLSLLEHQTAELKSSLEALTNEVLQLEAELAHTGVLVMDGSNGGVSAKAAAVRPTDRPSGGGTVMVRPLSGGAAAKDVAAVEQPRVSQQGHGQGQGPHPKAGQPASGRAAVPAAAHHHGAKAVDTV